MSTELPDLPEVDIPKTTPKTLTTDEFYIVNAAHIIRLHKAGLLKKTMDRRPTPVNKPFRYAE